MTFTEYTICKEEEEEEVTAARSAFNKDFLRLLPETRTSTLKYLLCSETGTGTSNGRLSCCGAEQLEAAML